MFGRDFEVCCLIEILKMKFDQDLCKTLWYELNPRVRCAFGNVFRKCYQIELYVLRIAWKMCSEIQ